MRKKPPCSKVSVLLFATPAKFFEGNVRLTLFENQALIPNDDDLHHVVSILTVWL